MDWKPKYKSRIKTDVGVPDLDGEIWKDIKDYEGYYKISNLGRVKTVRGMIPFGKHFRRMPERLLKPCTNRLGYYMVGLSMNKVHLTKKLHRLIAIAFIPNPNDKPHINHINGIRTDNRIENLEWCTRSENMQHAWDTGLNKWNETKQIATSKMASRPVVDLSNGKEYSSAKQAAKEFGYNYNTFKGWLNGCNPNNTTLQYKHKIKQDAKLS